MYSYLVDRLQIVLTMPLSFKNSLSNLRGCHCLPKSEAPIRTKWTRNFQWFSGKNEDAVSEGDMTSTHTWDMRGLE